ncbi:MAG: PIG-L family deacetylase [Actinomycetota bacterium]|nr:PIG-L family deacetylase [Actinomycetota bacterium]
MSRPRRTVVSVHAHPDDEALLTGGTLARLSAGGHRVVIVVATDGAAGLSDRAGGPDLGSHRMAELRRSAQILGCARVVGLGYADSGWVGGSPQAPPPGSFAAVSVEEAAGALAAVLREEEADVVTVYDRAGGYGHADHVRVHEVGIAAARQAGVPRVLEATIDRSHIRWALRILIVMHLVPGGTAVHSASRWYSSREEITHKVSVRAYAAQKRAALACHRSQAAGGAGPRTAALLLRLPRPLFARVCGTEWFIEHGAEVPAHPITDPMIAAPGSARTHGAGAP